VRPPPEEATIPLPALEPDELNQVLRYFNAARRALGPVPAQVHLEALGDALFHASEYLIAYGSLAPGQANHHQVANLGGTWREGWVYGSLERAGWASALGYLALRWTPTGAPVPAQLLHSPDLPAHWVSLDAFEGPGYRRILAPFFDRHGVVAVGNVYVAASSTGG